MAEKLEPVRAILSTCAFLRADSLDNGDTIALHFEGADGHSIAVLIPRSAAQAVHRTLGMELAKRSASLREGGAIFPGRIAD